MAAPTSKPQLATSSLQPGATAATSSLQPGPYTRLVHPDPVTNRIIQDIYDKLNALKTKVAP